MIYSFLRSILKLPRPNEIWGEGFRNAWNPLTIYLYLKLCWTQFSTHFGILIQVFNMVVSVGTLLVVTNTVNYGLVIVIGVVGLIGAFFVGHITIVKGVMKLDASAANNQNPELIEVLGRLDRIERKLDGKDN